ncbi:Crp/Fnr family transcriptional regulator [Chitinophaga rhizophila]|uniref:Crp/Fnr family transcriptional regulator n=1 Tax=Chitinophaga rhizophila TaxID=2866212 RepID=A0ABS7GC61_9BACT|nr:Crp/Fnr family transcriptional regulator [Chitinophaga rhizophila]MBW8685264.1 Crp/Fnr family transcriptional regulator [Chitinophaga rhizophila]
MNNLAAIFKATFDAYLDVPLHVWETFAQHGEAIQTRKNEIIKKHGERERYFYFILKGSGGIMLYQNNNYLCIDLCYDGDFFGDYLSFVSNRETDLEVICFEPCTLFRIDRDNFRELAKTPIGSVICQTASDNLFIQKQMQQLNLLSKTAEQRYIEMLEQQPDIIQRTPNKYIASYLGITPESFSRIRRKIM